MIRQVLDTNFQQNINHIQLGDITMQVLYVFWILRQPGWSKLLLPTITKIVNESLSSGILPTDMNKAILKPVLRKPSLDSEVLKIYRLITNLRESPYI